MAALNHPLPDILRAQVNDAKLAAVIVCALHLHLHPALEDARLHGVARRRTAVLTDLRRIHAKHTHAAGGTT